MKPLKSKFSESVQSVLPISLIILLLSISIAPISAGVLTLFLFGTLLLISGMALFTLGSEMAMQPLGDAIGTQIGKAKKWPLALVVCFFLGVIVTIAEPDLTVLSEQIPTIPNRVMILAVAGGVGVFLMIAMLRSVFGIQLSKLLLVFYPIVLVLALIAPKDFIAAAFDSGGVTTGPITVPFIMALGTGLASFRGDKHSADDSFGLVSLCSIGPILSVLILSICYRPAAATTETPLAEIVTTKDAFMQFVYALPATAKEMLAALAPIVGVFVILEICCHPFHRHQILRLGVGALYTFVGLTMFLTGANVGFMPAGKLIGASLATGATVPLLVPVGMLIGYFVVAAEPAVVVLKKQVEDISAGAISQKTIGLALAIGVAVSVGISMLRILTGIALLPILIAGYVISLGISFFVPSLYTSVAFDSGGVASGPMTTTFLLPFAVGACEVLGGNVMNDAFGIVAMVAITPLITIQTVGLIANIRRKIMHRKLSDRISVYEDSILYYDCPQPEPSEEVTL